MSEIIEIKSAEEAIATSKEGYQLYFECAITSNNPYKGMIAIGLIFLVSGMTKKNSAIGVWKVAYFTIEGIGGGWNLLPNEYRTMAGLMRAAKLMNCSMKARKK